MVVAAEIIWCFKLGYELRPPKWLSVRGPGPNGKVEGGLQIDMGKKQIQNVELDIRFNTVHTPVLHLICAWATTCEALKTVVILCDAST